MQIPLRLASGRPRSEFRMHQVGLITPALPSKYIAILGDTHCLQKPYCTKFINAIQVEDWEASRSRYVTQAKHSRVFLSSDKIFFKNISRCLMGSYGRVPFWRSRCETERISYSRGLSSQPRRSRRGGLVYTESWMGSKIHARKTPVINVIMYYPPLSACCPDEKLTNPKHMMH